MKILTISDTHGFHNDLNRKLMSNPYDMIIHAGDFSNYKALIPNEKECHAFLKWYNELSGIKYKLLVAGNHDMSLEAKRIDIKKLYPNIIYLEHESITIEGIKIFMSPYTLRFYDWAFNVDRDKIHRYWDSIEDDVDIVVTHGPCKNILDACRNYYSGLIENAGDEILYDTVVNRVKPKYFISGHIHNNNGIINQGVKTIDGINTVFINASCITDDQFNRGLSSFGVDIKI